MGCGQSNCAEAADVSTEQRAHKTPSTSPGPDAAASASAKEATIRLAEGMFASTSGRRFHESYSRLTLTSYGASCRVLTAFQRETGKKVAVKIIPKSTKNLPRQLRKVHLEVGIFKLVEDHPNAVRLLEVYEGSDTFYLVMECCEGGELFDHITKKRVAFTERHAAQILKSLMLFCAHMHSNNIAHMDLKPENIMFDSDGVNGVLKVIDFGSSVFVQEHELVKNAFGTVRYSSPEMAADLCGQKSDVWSAGVVMYILMCGRAPFLKANDNDTLKLIKSKPRVKFTGDKWISVSQSAKDCIRAMLDPDHTTRPSATDVLQMPWLKEQVPENEIQADILLHLRDFSNQSRIRRLLLGLMADHLVGGAANTLLGQFYSLDQDFSGVLEVQELVTAAKLAIPGISDEEIQRMFAALDSDRTGTVDVKEFFAGLLHTMDEDKQRALAQKSFTVLDKLGTGYVTKDTFISVLMDRAQLQAQPRSPVVPSLSRRSESSVVLDDVVTLDPAVAKELEAEFEALDANGDGVLSFDEFKAILGLKQTSEGQLRVSRPVLVDDDNSVRPAEANTSLATALMQRRGTLERTCSVMTAAGCADDLEAPRAATREVLELLAPAHPHAVARTHSQQMGMSRAPSRALSPLNTPPLLVDLRTNSRRQPSGQPAVISLTGSSNNLPSSRACSGLPPLPTPIISYTHDAARNQQQQFCHGVSPDSSIQLPTPLMGLLNPLTQSSLPNSIPSTTQHGINFPQPEHNHHHPHPYQHQQPQQLPPLQLPGIAWAAQAVPLVPAGPLRRGSLSPMPSSPAQQEGSAEALLAHAQSPTRQVNNFQSPSPSFTRQPSLPPLMHAMEAPA